MPQDVYALFQPEALRQPMSAYSTDKRSNSPVPRKCKVPGCTRKFCTLPTHLRFQPRQSRSNVELTRKKIDATSTAIESLAGTPENLGVIGRDGIDGLPTLPIKQCTDPQLRRLFHHFFSSVFERLAFIVRGPSVTSMGDYKQRMLQTALSNESYCMGLITQSLTDMSMARRTAEEDSQSLGVYTKSVASFRKQLISVQQNPHPLQIELALLSLCTLMIYDTHHSRNMALRMHWIGLRQLVDLRGGLHSVTLSLAYVVHVDRLCAIRLNENPTYVSASIHKLPLQRSPKCRYGSQVPKSEPSPRTPFLPQVLAHVADVCHVIEVWEVFQNKAKERPSLELGQSPMPSLEYLYYSRDKIEEQFALLHAQLWRDGSDRDKCLLWAARIVEYEYTWSCYVPTMNRLICDYLTAALQAQDLAIVWGAYPDMLTWILMVLIVAGVDHTGREWASDTLSRMITKKYNGPVWPERWSHQALENAQGFVWCQSLFEQRLQDACYDLEACAIVRGSTPDISKHTSASLIASSAVLARRLKAAATGCKDVTMPESKFQTKTTSMIVS